MGKNLTELVMVLDRSGSMGGLEKSIDEDYEQRSRKEGKN